jgi:hypothetical protein
MMTPNWTVHLPQAMQRHTGCAWVRPVPEDRKEPAAPPPEPRIESPAIKTAG